MDAMVGSFMMSDSRIKRRGGTFVVWILSVAIAASVAGWVLLGGGHLFPGAESSHPVTVAIRGHDGCFARDYPYSLDLRIAAPSTAVVALRSLTLDDPKRLRNGCMPSAGIEAVSVQCARKLSGDVTVFDSAAEIRIPNCIRGHSPLVVSGKYTVSRPHPNNAVITNEFSMSFSSAYSLKPFINPERVKQRQAEKTSQFMFDHLMRQAK